ncbi:MAG: 30S ribosomal protein S17e [Candidatus Brockarchaeota archaeon]|nr:30S ribosomal protein S17e [Candidatus Brockarchaeota archaeon]MBO3841042.1 30S ribosomal protein S17e [Candidatus Brockarchaeota archaeon]
MGKIYDSRVKGVARMLLLKYGNLFSDDFYANKQALRKIAVFQSKKLLNRVAGYITSVKSSEVGKQQEEVVEVGEE